MKIIKNILIIIGGVVAGSAAIYLVESLSHKLYPLPEGIDMSDSKAMKDYIFSLPMGAFLLLLLAYESGGFFAGFFTALLSDQQSKRRNTYFAGGLLTVGSAINLILIPHPIWFTVISLVVFIPFALLGSKVAPPLRRH